MILWSQKEITPFTTHVIPNIYVALPLCSQAAMLSHIHIAMSRTTPIRIAFILFLLCTVSHAVADDTPSRISLYGRNYAGRVLTANETRSSNWYMSYDVAAGFSTRRDSSVYAYKYGYPTWGVGIAVSRFSDLKVRAANTFCARQLTDFLVVNRQS